MPPEGSSDTLGWTWAHDRGALRLRFLGRGAPQPGADLERRLDPRPRALAWLRQVHSNRALEAHSGEVGEADALVTPRENLALAIATADCVPALLASDDRIAAVHAGWRGLVDGVLPATLSRLAASAGTVVAWLGPAIGPCCYEVGNDVAARLAGAADPAAITRRPGGRPHVDLHAVAEYQLRSHGVETIHRIELCTRCNLDLLSSFRGEGARAGRNWAVIWRQSF